MKKLVSHVITFVAGIACTYFFIIFAGEDADILSIKQNVPVVTDNDIKIVNNNGHEISLPKGTSLILKSQYREEGTYYLEIVATDLTKFSKSDGTTTYFTLEK
ncbi:hypothetical protein [Aliikangiella sp. G2MR2-5]|uniref:hypothetical protein n=1 Tax=Aliikangiella sp. G2MR2-5 TaxID=2788943 RepID=UPI0018AB6C42|nr:hypothetical protein [Aliikangiella sp. G2MR2-5]